MNLSVFFWMFNLWNHSRELCETVTHLHVNWSVILNNLFCSSYDFARRSFLRQHSVSERRLETLLGSCCWWGRGLLKTPAIHCFLLVHPATLKLGKSCPQLSALCACFENSHPSFFHSASKNGERPVKLLFLCHLSKTLTLPCPLGSGFLGARVTERCHPHPQPSSLPFVS